MFRFFKRKSKPIVHDAPRSPSCQILVVNHSGERPFVHLKTITATGVRMVRDRYFAGELRGYTGPYVVLDYEGYTLYSPQSVEDLLVTLKACDPHPPLVAGLAETIRIWAHPDDPNWSHWTRHFNTAA